LQLSENYESLTPTLLTWRIGWAPNNASKWQMGFNSAFKGLRLKIEGCNQYWYILLWFNWKIWDFCRDTHTLCSKLLWWQNFVWWCLIFVYPQYLTGILSPFWNLEFWDGCHISRKFMHPWIYILLLYFTRTSCFYMVYVIKKK